MSTLKEQAQIIRNETTPGANTAARIGDMFVNLVDEVDNKINKSVIANTTGGSTTALMSQKAITDKLSELDKVYITTLDITTLTNGEAVTSEQQTEVTNIFATNKPVICPTTGLYTKDTEDLWDQYILCVKEGILYAASINGTKWFTYQYDIRNKAFSSGYVECTTSAATAAKTITVTGMSALSTGIRLLVRMTNNNTANSATLNINSLGAKALYYNGSIVSADNTWEAAAVLDVYYNGANFQAADFTGKKTTVEGGIEDVPVYQDYRRTAFFERRNGGWHVRNYYAGGDLGLIQSASDSANLNNALGPYSEFMQAVDSNVNIFTSFYTKDGKSYPGYIPIYYNKRSAENTINIYWIVESKITNIIVDISGNKWGNILEFNQMDIANIECPYIVHIVTAMNTEKNDNISPNRIEVRLDRELQEGYSLVLLRRKKVRYRNNTSRRVREKGIGYRLVTSKQGFADGMYRERGRFIAKLKFYYDKTNQWYRLVDDTGKTVTPFDFALHYTEVQDGVLKVSCAGRQSRRLYKFSDPVFGGKRLKYKMQFGIAVIKYQHEGKVDGGYIICSNIAKMEFSFSNMYYVTEIDPTVDEQLKQGFEVHVIN